MLPRTPKFWQEDGWPARLLDPVGRIYGRVTLARMEQAPRYRPEIPVIAVGNPTVGGAGKTPTTLALARLLRSALETPMIVTRGYGGRLAGPHAVTPEDRAADVGDEALVTAASHPTIVARPRGPGVDLARDLGASVVLFDDGFQNPEVQKRLSVLVVDEGYGIGNGRIFPAGPLRAPLREQVARADLMVLVRDPGGEDRAAPIRSACEDAGVPIFAATLRPVDAARFANWPVVAYAGIGRPEKFAASLAAAGAIVKDFLPFPDHHVYGEAEAKRILDRAADLGAQPVTTTKDWVRMDWQVSASVDALKAASDRLDIELVFDRPVDLVAMVARRLRRETPQTWR